MAQPPTSMIVAELYRIRIIHGSTGDFPIVHQAAAARAAPRARAARPTAAPSEAGVATRRRGVEKKRICWFYWDQN